MQFEVKPCPFCGHPFDPESMDVLYPSGTHWCEHADRRIHFASRREVENCVKVKRSPVVASGPVWGLHCPEHEGGCGASISGLTKEECLARWNRRSSPS